MLHSARGMRKRVVVGTVVLAGVLGFVGCDSPVDEGPEPYALVTVNEQSLPAPYPDPFLYPQGSPQPSEGAALEVASGTLDLGANGTLRMELVMQCASPPPAGTECEIEGDGRNVYDGTYSLSEDRVQIGDRQYPVVYGSDSVEITIQVPPSAGVWPRFVLEFRR